MEVNRVIGKYVGREHGAMLIFTAGVHGNETSGVVALQRVFEALETFKPDIKGSVIGLAGNVKAIQEEVRYVDADLNRLWLDDIGRDDVAELRERDELRTVLVELFEGQDDEVCFFDLHATSSESAPFLIMSDTIRNRELAKIVDLPVVLGLMEHLKGMLIDVTSRSGFPTVLFQAGQNRHPDSISHHMGLIWKMLMAKCALAEDSIPDIKLGVESLEMFRPKDEDKRFFEIIDSKKLKPGDEFSMHAGYKNFQPVQKGEVLGDYEGREMTAGVTGQIFMPLYQQQGQECFYIVRPIKIFWINFSIKFRRFRYHHKLHWLLGVKKIGPRPLTYRLDDQITFLWAIEIFHLLGYIKVWQDGPYIYMARREDARNPPTPQEAMADFSKSGYLRSELKNIKEHFKIPFSNNLPVSPQ